MWGQAGKWLQEKAQEVAAKAEEVRHGRLVQDLEAHGKALVQGLVAASAKISEQEALYHARLTPVTDRLVGMAFPEPLEAVARLLQNRYKGHYMVWNLSEEAYDYSKFDNQVLEYRFPGHPAPPLGLMVKIALAVENWLQADEQNVAVVHCLTGKGRTATVLSALLCWLDVDVGQGPGGPTATTMQALQFVSEKMGLDPDKATIPSQRRYLEYFNTMLEGVKPRSEPLLLRRVIMNTIPRFGAPPAPPTTEEEGEQSQGGGGGGPLGCCPYLQLFKGGKLIFTAPCSRDGSLPLVPDAQPTNSTTAPAPLPWAVQSDGSAIFNVDCAVQGDVLLRVRHLAVGGQKISMCRAGFHTGYVPHGILRLSKSQLDGACLDGRFDQDFFMDLIFAPAGVDIGDNNGATTTTTTTSTSTTSPVAVAEGEGEGGKTKAVAVNTASQRRDLGRAQDVEDRDNYDAMLHTDTRFWNEIAARKRRAAARARKAKLQGAMAQQSSSSQQQPQQPAFSILEGDDREDESLVVFDATPSAALPTPTLPPLSQRGGGGGSRAMAGLWLEDDDLLLGGAEDPSHHREDAAEADELIRELQAATAAIDVGSGAAAPTAATATVAAPPAEAKPSSSSSGAVLAGGSFDDLEKELGLGELSVSSLLADSASGGGGGGGGGGGSGVGQPQAGAGAGAAGTGALDGLDDNLDEFESFLESLESSGGGNKAQGAASK